MSAMLVIRSNFLCWQMIMIALITNMILKAKKYVKPLLIKWNLNTALSAVSITMAFATVNRGSRLNRTRVNFSGTWN